MQSRNPAPFVLLPPVPPPRRSLVARLGQAIAARLGRRLARVVAPAPPSPTEAEQEAVRRFVTGLRDLNLLLGGKDER
jgi:hypothetical protein